MRTRGQADQNTGFTAAAGALALMLGVTVLLVIINAMEGPNFLHQGPAWPEAVIFAVLGAAIGLRAAVREKPGLLGFFVESGE